MLKPSAQIILQVYRVISYHMIHKFSMIIDSLIDLLNKVY